jgi:hypothetical protein
MAASTAIAKSAAMPARPLLRRELEDKIASEVAAYFRTGVVGSRSSKPPTYRRALRRLGYAGRKGELKSQLLATDLAAFLGFDSDTLKRLGPSNWWLRMTTDVPGHITTLQRQVFHLFLQRKLQDSVCDWDTWSG